MAHNPIMELGTMGGGDDDPFITVGGGVSGAAQGSPFTSATTSSDLVLSSEGPSATTSFTTDPVFSSGEVAVEEGPSDLTPTSDLISSITVEGNPAHDYLTRSDEFTSERFKIEVRGLPKFYGFGELKKLLNSKLGLNAHRIKPPKVGSGYMFVNFKSEEERLTAIKVLDGYKWKNKTLSALGAKAAEDPLARKRSRGKMEEEGPEGSQSPSSSTETIHQRIQWATTPWKDIPYTTQLERKIESIKEIAIDMKKRIKEVNAVLGQDLTLSVEEIKPSPVTQHYRNKCEFTIGRNPETSEVTVGFRVSSYKKGSVGVGPVEHLIHLPEKMIQGVLAFQEFVRNSQLSPYDPETHKGCWKQLTVRTTEGGQIMFVVLISPKHTSVQEIETLKLSLKTTFASHESPKIDSFYFKVLEGHGQKERNAPELLFGEERITETLMGLHFTISPEAFFQVNSKAAEVLYSTIASLLDLNPDSTVLDICCGTGTIGISVAEKCGQVLGIEMISSAVEDAVENTKRNSLDNKCKFYAGKAEDLIDAVLTEAQFPEIVAIVDPPRAGLHQRVLLLLRRCERIKRLIYVSCDARAAMKNFVDLTRPISKTYKGPPFLPTRLIPVDLFPHSHHCELIIQFNRT